MKQTIDLNVEPDIVFDILNINEFGILDIQKPILTFRMNRRKSLKVLGASVAGIAGLALVDWKWQIIDNLTHKGFFTLEEEKLISSIADTIIPEGLPPIVPSAEAKPIGALSTGTDKYLIKLFEHCYEKEDQDMIKQELEILNSNANSQMGDDFFKLPKSDRENLLRMMGTSEDENQKKFFDLMKEQTIVGFTTVKEVMVEYRDYKVAPGFYTGCADVPAKA